MNAFRAFVTALCLFACTCAGALTWARHHAVVSPDAYAVETAEYKSVSYAGLTGNMQENMIPVFGSSEFQHGAQSFYHPARLFADSDFTPMLIGAGYYQSLSHALTLAAIEDSMQERKAVLILSPQWFRKTGVVDQAYISRFSEILYQNMLQNDALSQETKEYISRRTEKLLAPDESTLERIRRDEASLWKKEASREDRTLEAIWIKLLEKKDTFTVAVMEALSGIHSQEPHNASTKRGREPDWEQLLALAEETGRKENTNPFWIDDKSYEKLLPVLPSKKGMNADAKKGYQTGPEFDDLRCFLTVCRETGVQTMLVLVPVNGYYYDYTQFPQSAREAYYEKIRQIAAEYETKIADFSKEEYTHYFFEDRVHLGKVGWIYVNQAIYDFYKS